MALYRPIPELAGAALAAAAGRDRPPPEPGETSPALLDEEPLIPRPGPRCASADGGIPARNVYLESAVPEFERTMLDAPAPPTGSSRKSEPRTGCRRARFFRLIPALALLLGGFSLFAAAPAVAQTTVWSATLNVKNLGGTTGYGCLNSSGAVSARCSTTATLSDDDFEFPDGGTEYTVTSIVSSVGALDIGFDKAFPQSLSGATLHIGSSRSHTLASASISGTLVSWTGIATDYPQLTLGARADSVQVEP